MPQARDLPTSPALDPVVPAPTALGVVGLGLIGTSVALAARRRWPGLRIVGVDGLDALLQPQVVEVVDVASPSPDALIGVEVIVLAMPVDAIAALVAGAPPALADAALVIDTGSTKRDVVAAARRAGLARFVGGHPMAGGASRGAGQARADLFDDRLWFLVEDRDAQDPAAFARAVSLVAALGARAHPVDAETHDAAMAAVSHLPQVVASLLMALVAEAAGDDRLAWAGAGLRDTTRLAASPPDIWTSVLASNAACVAPLVTELAARLQALAPALGDADAVARVFAQAQAARARLDAASSAR